MLYFLSQNFLHLVILWTHLDVKKSYYGSNFAMKRRSCWERKGQKKERSHISCIPEGARIGHNWGINWTSGFSKTSLFLCAGILAEGKDFCTPAAIHQAARSNNYRTGYAVLPATTQNAYCIWKACVLHCAKITGHVAVFQKALNNLIVCLNDIECHEWHTRTRCGGQHYSTIHLQVLGVN